MLASHTYSTFVASFIHPFLFLSCTHFVLTLHFPRLFLFHSSLPQPSLFRILPLPTFPFFLVGFLFSCIHFLTISRHSYSFYLHTLSRSPFPLHPLVPFLSFFTSSETLSEPFHVLSSPSSSHFFFIWCYFSCLNSPLPYVTLSLSFFF